MIINVTDHTKYLYHYTRAETAINYILKDRTLRLSEYTSTNDPKETKAWRFSFFTTSEDLDLSDYSHEDMSAWLSSKLKRDTRLICFSQDTAPLSGNHLEDIFKRGFCKPRMWAQYADNHTGVCLVFDREKLQQQVVAQLKPYAPILHGPVRYGDHGIAEDIFADQTFTINCDELEKYGQDNYPLIHLLRHHHKLFFEKMSDWSAESEYRWIVFSKANTPIYLRYRHALAGIVFGEETAEEHKREIATITGGKSVELRGLKWKNHSPWFDFERTGYK